MLVIRAVIFRVFSTLSVISCYDTLVKPLFFLPEIVEKMLTSPSTSVFMRNTCKKIELPIGSNSDHYIV